MTAAWLLPTLLITVNTFGAEIELLKSRDDVPYRVPRPTADQQAVPTGTSIYFELAVTDTANGDIVLGESVEVRLKPDRQPATVILGKGIRFAPDYTGFVRPGKDRKYTRKLTIYIDSDQELLPKTKYTVQVTAQSRDGVQLSSASGNWQFTTAAAPKTHPVDFAVDLDAPPVRWHGGFFTGVCGVTFGGTHANRMSTYELMDEVRRTSPRAWSLQRDFWMTGMEHRWSLLGPKLPNIVRELQTRRITAIEPQEPGTLLRVEDFFGHGNTAFPPIVPWATTTTRAMKC